MRTVRHRPELPRLAPVDTLPARAADTDALPGANRGERRFALELDARRAAGTVARWWWAPGSLRIAPNLHYKPDFLVQGADGVLTLVDVKGAKGTRFWCEEDAWVKIKTVAALYPYRVVIAWEKGGMWHEERVGAGLTDTAEAA